MKILLLLFTFSLYTFTYAQNKHSLTDITKDGDLIIIPEHKFSEFIQKYSKDHQQNKTIAKTILSEGLEGKVTDAFTTQPLTQKKITLNLYDPNIGTFLGTVGPVWTDLIGHYFFNNIMDIDDEQQTETTDAIKYFSIRIETNLNIKTFKLYNGIGQEVINTQENNKTITPQMSKLASGVYYADLITDREIYKNKILIQEGKIVGVGQKTIKISKTKSRLEKITEIGATITILDSTNQNHEYINGPMGNWTGQRNADFTLIPRMDL